MKRFSYFDTNRAIDTYQKPLTKIPAEGKISGDLMKVSDCAWAVRYYFLFRYKSACTAQATVQPTIGLLPIPRKPIIST